MKYKKIPYVGDFFIRQGRLKLVQRHAGILRSLLPGKTVREHQLGTFAFFGIGLRAFFFAGIGNHLATNITDAYETVLLSNAYECHIKLLKDIDIHILF